MNSDVNTSPLSSAQSWIVENISSLISSNQEDENDCTLTMPKEQHPKPAHLDCEIERSRTVTQELLTERIPKRPFSPEEIQETPAGYLPMHQLYTNQCFFGNNQNFQCLDELRPLEFENGHKPFPKSSSFYDDLNLDEAKNNKLLSSFMNRLPQPQAGLQPLPMISINQPGSRDNCFDIVANDATTVKKKKLTNYSLSSSNLPQVSITHDNNNRMNNSTVSFNEDELLTRNLSNSFYNSSYSSMCSSGISHSSSFSNNCSTDKSMQQKQIFLKEDKQSLNHTSTPSNKLLNKLIGGNGETGNDNCQSNLNNWDFVNNNESSFGQAHVNSQEKNNLLYYELIKKNNFKNLGQQQQQQQQLHQQQQQQQQQQIYNHQAYTDALGFDRPIQQGHPWNDHLDFNYENLKENYSKQFQPNTKFPKKITKSSTTLFNQDNQSAAQQQKASHFFPHSTSYDNMSSLSKPNKPMKHFTNDFMCQSSTDFLLESSFNNSLNPKSGFYSHNNTMPTNKTLHQSINTQNNNTMLNTSNCSGNSTKDLPILHVRNLDYKISADEWKRILLENFRKHCKEILSVNVITNADKSLLGIVRLATKDDARLAISCLHHKKIGYKRLNVTFAATNNSPKSKIIALLKNNELKEMPLTRFISLYEAKYNQSIAINELFSLKEIVQIFHKDGQGRQIKLIGRNFQSSIDSEEENLRQSPFCNLHSQKTDFNYHIHSGSLTGGSALSSSSSSSSSTAIGWLPNVIVSLRTFKSAVHKLLNDHGGQMPLLSFMDCYKCCIFNENSMANNHRGNNNLNQSNGVHSAQSNNGSSNNNSNTSSDLSYQLIIDNENGVSLEHLITCAQDVQIQYNQGFFKQLQWENDKSKPINLQSRNSTTASKNRYDIIRYDSKSANDQSENYCNDLDESIEDSQRKLNQFSHEVVELFKEKPKCIIQMSNFTTEYHKKYGRQLRLADYDSNLYQNLKELLESIPHILQILDSQYDKKLTLTHRVQVRRFSNDLIKVLKSHPTKQMFANEYPVSYEKHFGRKFDIKDYGVCYLEDMLAELPESIICRKEIEGRTFIQIPKIVQMDEERLCTNRLTFDIIDMLKHKSRFSIQFNKFIPNFHHHFGRQCKLSNYGFTKLIELLEAMPETVHVINKDNLQFVQLKENIMLDLICLNVVKYLEDSNLKLKTTLTKLEEIYCSRYETIYYQDFGCDNFAQLFQILPIKKHFISAQCVAKSDMEKEDDMEWLIQCEPFNEKELKRVAKLMLKKLIDDQEDTFIALVKEAKSNMLKSYRFNDLIELLGPSSSSNDNLAHTIYNNRSICFLRKILNDYFIFDDKDETSIVGLSELYVFAKKIRSLFKLSKISASDMTMTIPEIEFLYDQIYVKSGAKDGSLKVDQLVKSDNGNNCLPFKRLGFIDVYLLFSQGIHLLVTVKKYTERRVCLNREFWPKSNVSDTVVQNISSDSFSSPISPINTRVQSRTPFTNITPLSNNSNGTPISDRMSSSFSSSSLNFSRRSVFSNSISNAANSSYDHPSHQNAKNVSD